MRPTWDYRLFWVVWSIVGVIVARIFLVQPIVDAILKSKK